MSGSLQAGVHSAYIHIPLCRQRCAYCDFFSSVETEEIKTLFLRRLHEEIETSEVAAGTFETIYFGGGTPSRLAGSELGIIIEALEHRFGIAHDAEISMEANPADISSDYLGDVIAAGINRLSLGVQSFDDSALRFLSREHSGPEAFEATRRVADAGFRSFSIDLIHGLPGFEIEPTLAALGIALELGVPHMSIYGLTYCDGSSFGKALAGGRMAPKDPDAEADTFEEAIAILTSAGLEHYEISSFCRPGHRCLHNIRTWKEEPLLALGPSAAGATKGYRYRNPSNMRDYLAKKSPQIESSEAREMEVESIIAGLRLLEGLGLERFHKRHNRRLGEAFPRALKTAREYGLVKLDDHCLRLNGLRGILLADKALALFVDEALSRG